MNKYEIMETCWRIDLSVLQTQATLLRAGFSVTEGEILDYWMKLEEQRSFE